MHSWAFVPTVAPLRPRRQEVSDGQVDVNLSLLAYIAADNAAGRKAWLHTWTATRGETVNHAFHYAQLTSMSPTAYVDNKGCLTLGKLQTIFEKGVHIYAYIDNFIFLCQFSTILILRWCPKTGWRAF